jgi:DNA (cytosine-5)-methyltransferase 1
MNAYYNEIDPYAAQWLRNLIAAGHIAPGDVDERSIVDVQPDDLAGYGQCHFFAGIGGWSVALRLAGWPDDRPVWTGSCPCQPFSPAGTKGGFADERHVWPSWHHLIREREPSIIFGEQVASRAGLEWFDLVALDLEGEGYAVGAADLCAAGIGAPHIRQRLWFVAHAKPQLDWLRDTRPTGRIEPANGGSDRAVQNGAWIDCDFLSCEDGRIRFTRSGLFPMAHGIPARVAKLRAYGNAIVPQVAVEFIKAAGDWR